MSEAVKTTQYNQGSYIAVEGEKSNGCFYIIQEGQVLLTRTSAVKELSRELLNTGDFFEVESGLTGYKRLSTAIAKTDVVILTIEKNMFDILIQKRPSIVEKFIRSFSNKMRILDHILAKISFQSTSTALSLQHVFDVATYYDNKGEIQSACFTYYNLAQQNLDHELAKKAMERYETIVSQLSEEQKATIKEVSSGIIKIPKNTMVVAEGLQGNTMFFIQEGNIKICKISNDSELIFAVLKKGDLFGEMALLESKPRSASAITTAESELLVINHQTFPLLVQRNPKIITRITTVLADRIWFIYRQIINASLKTIEEKIYDGIQMFMEKVPGYELQKKFSLKLSLSDFLIRIGVDEKKAKPIIEDLLIKDIIIIEDNEIVVLNTKLIASRAQLFRNSQQK